MAKTDISPHATPHNTSAVRWFGGRVSFLYNPKAWIVVLGLLISLVVIGTNSLMSGTLPIPAIEVLYTIMGYAPSNIIDTVVWEFRFPRMLVAFYVGFFLSLSGAILQNLSSNPLADPSLVGVSQGASLAVVALYVALPGVRAVYAPLVAFVGASGVTLLIQALSFNRGNANSMRFILTGVGISALISALIGMMLTYGRITNVHSALVWLSGSLHSSSWEDFKVLSVLFVLTVPLLFWAYRSLSAMRFGRDLAIGLGLNAAKAQVYLIVLSSALAAFAVCTVGPLGFVGLVAPHVARRLLHCGMGMQIIITGLVGAMLVSLADYIGRIALAPLQISAGIVMAIIGCPIFVLLILQKHRMG